MNWAASKRVVLVSSRDSDTYTPARELSDAMSALLYNLDNTITLRTKPDQRWRSLSKIQVGVHGEVNGIVADAQVDNEVEKSHH